MDINTESMFLKGEDCFFQDTARIECKTDIDSADVVKVLGIYTKSTDIDGKIENEKIMYKANIIYSICYIDSQKNIRKCEISSPLSGEIVSCSANGYLSLDVKKEKVEADVSSLKVIIKGIFTVTATVSEQKKCDYVAGGEGLILRKQSQEYYKGYGKRKTIFPIEEEFTLGYCISNVLMHKTTSNILAVQCGVGCIIVDGETYISSLLLQKNENNDIIREQKVVPFRAEIEYDEAMPIMIANATVKENSFKTDISVDEEKGESVVKVSLSLLFEGEAYSVSNNEISVDAFSLKSELDRQISVALKVKPLEQRSFTQEIDGKSIMVDLPEKSTFKAISFEDEEISNIKSVDGKLEVAGVVSFIAFFKDENGDVLTRKLESDFETSLLVGNNEKASYNVTSNIIAISASFNSNQLEVKYTIVFTVYGMESEKIEILTNVTENGEKQLNNSSISVFIALPNEDLWSLAKRLNTSPNEICEINKELQFPLTGNERIVVYRQKR